MKLSSTLSLPICLIFAIILLFSFIYLNNLEAIKRDYQRKSDIAQLKLAIEMYYDDNFGKYPRTEQEPDLKGWSILKQSLEEKYLDKAPLDPLNNKKYNYQYGSLDGKSYQILFKMEKLQLVTRNE